MPSARRREAKPSISSAIGATQQESPETQRILCEAAMAAIRAALVDWRKYLVGVFTQVLGNPVIGRELRVRVRVGRAYLLQAFYLAFLILIVALAYQAAIGDNPDLRNPVRVQEALVEFYRIVMSMLVALIALIAPALTANAITLERERKTMDLLLATPLTARQLLVGKLLGSFAFIVLLLALTLPVSAVSVLLGGVSFPELLKAYLLVACGGLVLCAIALFSSVYARNSTLAVLWSYLRVAGFLLATGVLIALQEALAFGAFGGRGAGALNLAFPQVLLNPFAAPFAADMQVDFVRWQVPAWIVGVVICLLFTRLILTAAARKVGLYDKDVLPSARRQLLLLFPLNMLLCVLPLLARGGGAGGIVGAEYVLLVVLLCVAPFLLLAAWIAPFGQDGDTPCPDDGMFKPSRMFTAAPSGALPFLWTAWLLTAGALILVLYQSGMPAMVGPLFWNYLLSMLVYFTGVWMLFWGIGRFCSVMLRARSLATARALTLVAITGVIALPVIIDLMFFWNHTEFVALQVWVFKPFFDALSDPRSAKIHDAMFLWGSGMVLIGLLLGAFRRRAQAQGTETPSHGV
jgi:ABC-type transport system involved in multi-copper enzyme maturation, permease component